MIEIFNKLPSSPSLTLTLRLYIKTHKSSSIQQWISLLFYKDSYRTALLKHTFQSGQFEDNLSGDCCDPEKHYLDFLQLHAPV